ncbi:unnamed protein product [Owenia fusiformis]|uniref:Uncharacterized protein n=1 Tax=Owenia fusiformis TaxID=6347 RepID=A0A8S4PJ81_OWEFU|nr:unnamed protein product [Owenia fusiformis]
MSDSSKNERKSDREDTDKEHLSSENRNVDKNVQSRDTAKKHRTVSFDKKRSNTSSGSSTSSSPRPKFQKSKRSRRDSSSEHSRDQRRRSYTPDLNKNRPRRAGHSSCEKSRRDSSQEDRREQRHRSRVSKKSKKRSRRADTSSSDSSVYSQYSESSPNYRRHGRHRRSYSPHKGYKKSHRADRYHREHKRRFRSPSSSPENRSRYDKFKSRRIYNHSSNDTSTHMPQVQKRAYFDYQQREDFTRSVPSCGLPYQKFDNAGESAFSVGKNTFSQESRKFPMRFLQSLPTMRQSDIPHGGHSFEERGTDFIPGMSRQERQLNRDHMYSSPPVVPRTTSLEETFSLNEDIEEEQPAVEVSISDEMTQAVSMVRDCFPDLIGELSTPKSAYKSKSLVRDKTPIVPKSLELPLCPGVKHNLAEGVHLFKDYPPNAFLKDFPSFDSKRFKLNKKLYQVVPSEAGVKPCELDVDFPTIVSSKFKNQKQGNTGQTTKSEINPRPFLAIKTMADWEGVVREQLLTTSHTEWFIGTVKPLFEELLAQGNTSEEDVWKEKLEKALTLVKVAGRCIEDNYRLTTYLLNQIVACRRHSYIGMRADRDIPFSITKELMSLDSSSGKLFQNKLPDVKDSLRTAKADLAQTRILDYTAPKKSQSDKPGFSDNKESGQSSFRGRGRGSNRGYNRGNRGRGSSRGVAKSSKGRGRGTPK